MTTIPDVNLQQGTKAEGANYTVGPKKRWSSTLLFKGGEEEEDLDQGASETKNVQKKTAGEIKGKQR